MIKDFKNFGFTLIFASLVVSIVLIIGLGVFDIILREIRLSGLGGESRIAFYAADTGVECALYWDIKKQAFSPIETKTIECLGQSFSVGGSTFSSFKLNLPNGSCAKVDVKKTLDLGGKVIMTEITSYGYNLSCDSSDPKRVNRTLRVTY